MTNTIQTENALLVTVPSGAKNFRIMPRSKLRYEAPFAQTIDLPLGEYEILGLASEIDKGTYNEYVKDYEADLNPQTTLVLKRK